MAIASVTNTIDTTGQKTGSGSTTALLNTDAFMNMLVTQLKYQDPLDPMKTNEFMSQLAQLTQVERLQNIYDTLGNLQTATETGNLIDMVGKKISVDGNILSQADELTLNPSTDYDTVVFSIKNLADNSISTVTRHKGESLTYVNEATANVQVAAAAYKDGAAVDSTSSAYRVVRGIKGTGSSAYLVAGNGDEYKAGSIKYIKN
ncbi:MAG: flagellar hook capping FlgD N-terminal domain-containing protein [Syntrophorhabdus sp.]